MARVNRKVHAWGVTWNIPALFRRSASLRMLGHYRAPEMFNRHKMQATRTEVKLVLLMISYYVDWNCSWNPQQKGAIQPYSDVSVA
jgi:hypothetical protein